MDTVDVPQTTNPSQEVIVKFTAHLRSLFFEAVFNSDKRDFAKLKRWASLSLHPDKLNGVNAKTFTKKLHSAASKTVKGLPNRLFNEYVDTVNSLEFVRGNRIASFSNLFIFWNENIRSCSDAASEQQKKIETHNKKVVQYLVYCFNATALNITLDVWYHYYGYPKWVATCLYYLSALINALLLLVITIPLLTGLILSWVSYRLRSSNDSCEI